MFGPQIIHVWVVVLMYLRTSSWGGRKMQKFRIDFAQGCTVEKAEGEHAKAF